MESNAVQSSIQPAAKDAGKAFDQSFSKPIIRYGMLTLLLSIPLCFIPCIYLWVAYGAIPPFGIIMTGWFLIISIYGGAPDSVEFAGRRIAPDSMR